MGEYLQQIGVAGILIVLILDRVFAFLTKQRIGRESALASDAGTQSTDYWRKVNREVADEALAASTVPILRQLTEIISRMEARSGQLYDMSLRQGYVIDDVQKSLERLRLSSHTANDQLQKIIAKVTEPA